jgi:hypothetical protein
VATVALVDPRLDPPAAECPSTAGATERIASGARA